MFFLEMILDLFSFRLAYALFILKRVLIEFSGGECYYFDVAENVQPEMREKSF